MIIALSELTPKQRKEPLSRELCISIGDRIRSFRERKDWSQQELGAIVYLSQDVISKIEIGQRDARATELHAIAKAFGIPVSDLIS